MTSEDLKKIERLWDKILDMMKQDRKKEEDKGEELLKQVVDPELIEVRDSMDEE